MNFSSVAPHVTSSSPAKTAATGVLPMRNSPLTAAVLWVTPPQVVFLDQGTRENTQGLVIPKGSTLAFRIIQLCITDGEWICHHRGDTNISNWPSLGQQHVHLQSHQGLALLDMVEASGSFSQKPPLWTPATKNQAMENQHILPSCVSCSWCSRPFPSFSSFRKINLDHSFIQQLQETDMELYVVIEILKASEVAVCKESTKADGGVMAKIYATFSAQGTSEKNEGIVIPKGCTLAFRTMQIHIRDGAWDLEYFPGIKRSYAGPLQGTLGVGRTGVENCCQIFSELSPDLMFIILNTIKAVMRDNNLLQELSQKVENLLKHDLEYDMQPFNVDARLLSFPHKEEQRLTIALVQLSGVQLQEDGSALPRDQPFEDVAALFVALYALNLLSASK
ncbi:hypothetical protein HGM15179_013990 [Zosterops borbonicus]|uniref:Gasdermin pore forming domain-containing protein n=1 Tax=Zosterops borbonicus TaxID=364589 RepID=A0A8K1G7M5_9PASS|nr:hypothetical protein HGM15179_013990 [Zosterops borbonicus]